MFTLTESFVHELFLLNHFPVPSDEMVFFGLRGCVPVQPDDHSFLGSHELEVVEIDNRHPRCTIGQWLPGTGIALFPGSTVPSRRSIKKALDKGGKGTNQLMTGLFPGYRQDIHKKGSDTAHEAFRQTGKLPIRRTADDLDYDEDDRVEYTRPYDNLHAAWSDGVDDDNYGSAGCQVVAGYPKCKRRNNRPDKGPWKVFKENAYDLPQDTFTYMLLDGSYVQYAVLAGSIKLMERLRFGSQGQRVEELQKNLKYKGYYTASVDGDFGSKTLFAILEYQEANLGSDQDDGVVGPVEAGSLGMDWLL